MILAVLLLLSLPLFTHVLIIPLCTTPHGLITIHPHSSFSHHMMMQWHAWLLTFPSSPIRAEKTSCLSVTCRRQFLHLSTPSNLPNDYTLFFPDTQLHLVSCVHLVAASPHITAVSVQRSYLPVYEVWISCAGWI